MCLYLEDLDVGVPPKDESKSCIFDFPDRPIDTLPPEYPPIDPPDCYPYCGGDDVPPPPIFPPSVIVIPPDVTPVPDLGLEFEFLQGLSGVGQFFNDNTTYLKIGITGMGEFGNFAGTPIYNDLFPPFSIGTSTLYYGAGGTQLDHVLALSAGHELTSRRKGFEISIPKLFATFPEIPIFLIDIFMGQVKMTVPPNPPGEWPLAGNLYASASRGNSNYGYNINTLGFPSDTPTPPYTIHAEFYVTRPNNISTRARTEKGVVIPAEI